MTAVNTFQIAKEVNRRREIASEAAKSNSPKRGRSPLQTVSPNVEDLHKRGEIAPPPRKTPKNPIEKVSTTEAGNATSYETAGETSGTENKNKNVEEKHPKFYRSKLTKKQKNKSEKATCEMMNTDNEN